MIVIVGAGIGGLTLGCALARSGRRFTILERAPELLPVGAGIALSANALRALAYIGLDERVRACGRELGEVVIADPAGTVISTTRVAQLVPGGTIGMARARLQETLVDALGSPVQLGTTVSGYAQSGGLVRVALAGGASLDAELLVGADGLHSTVRRVMRGDEPLRYTGQVAWRGISDGVRLEPPDRFTETWGPGLRFGIVPIDGARVYWFAVAQEPPGGRDAGDPRTALLARFADWHAPIEKLIAATPGDRIVRTDLTDRVPVARWVDGQVALLGDAAHPMTPNIGMGGCQAIEDAVVLSDALEREPSVASALARYQSVRVARANGFVQKSYRVGQVAQLSSAPLRWLRDRVMSAVPMRVSAKALLRDLDFRL